MFRKHLSQYTDEELRAEIKRLVDDQVQEGKKLDYKEDVSLDTKNGRREVARDTSSFANEIGGAVIYGIPEDRKSDEVAVPIKPYGIQPIRDFEIRAENICADTIAPLLPGLQIRKVDAEDVGKVVYVVWHPESWMAPHMVEGYDENRYYRRGLLRVVRMDEHEVKQKYAQVQDQLDRVKDLLESPEINFYVAADSGSKTHIVCCPLMLVPDRVDFSSNSMKQWLAENLAVVGPDAYQWSPSYHGVRASREKSYEIRIVGSYCELHRNGAANYFQDTPLSPPDELLPEDLRGKERFVVMWEALAILRDLLRYCGGFYEEIGYYGPLALRLRVTRCAELGFVFSRRRQRRSEDPVTKYAVLRGVLHIDSFISGAQLIAEPKSVLKVVADRISQAFGWWESDGFDKDLNLIPK